MKPQRVAVTGIGAVSPFGGDAHHLFDCLLAGKSAVRLYAQDAVPRGISVPAVRCTDFDPDATLGRGLAHTMDRFSQLGTVAALAAWQDAGLPAAEPGGRDDAGVSWSSALGGTLTFEGGYKDLYLNRRERVSPLSVVLGMNNAAASHIAIKLGLGDLCYTYSVACASSAIAVGEAFRRIRDGQAALMVAGGSEAPLSYAVIRAWEALRVMAQGDEATAPHACRPFHAERTGLVLGEGAGALILENWDSAKARGATIYAELTGYGTTCDHAHLVRPEARGQVRAMRLALADSGLDASEIDYINAHGTATREGDPTEIAAIREVLGDRAADVRVSATKSMHGHMLGATGVIEAIATVLSLYRQAVPPTAHLDAIDPLCAGVHHVITGESAVPLRAALSNSFAFGGSNAVLAFRRTA